VIKIFGYILQEKEASRPGKRQLQATEAHFPFARGSVAHLPILREDQ
jgi:hypothetical protein